MSIVLFRIYFTLVSEVDIGFGFIWRLRCAIVSGGGCSAAALRGLRLPEGLPGAAVPA